MGTLHHSPRVDALLPMRHSASHNDVTDQAKVKEMLERMEGSTHGTKGLMEIPQRPGASAAVSIPQPAAAERPRARSPGNSVHAGDCVRTVIGRGVMPNEDNLRSMLKSLLSRGRRERWLLPPEVRVRVRLRAALIYSARARYPGRCAGCVGGGFICVCVPQQWSVLRVSACVSPVSIIIKTRPGAYLSRRGVSRSETPLSFGA